MHYKQSHGATNTSSYPKYYVKSKYEIFDAAADFLTLVMLS